MLPLQGTEHGLQDARQVRAEGAQDDGKVPPFPVQALQKAEEGRQHQVVALGLLAFDGEHRVWSAWPFQQLQVVPMKVSEPPPRGRVGERGAAAVVGVKTHRSVARGKQRGGITQPLPLTWNRKERSSGRPRSSALK